MDTTEHANQMSPQRQRIPLALLDPMDSSHSLDEESIGRLQLSIAAWGLMQPPVGGEATERVTASLRRLMFIFTTRA